MAAMLGLGAGSEYALLSASRQQRNVSQATAQLVEQLRDETIPRAVEGTRTEALVGRATARLVDEAPRRRNRHVARATP
jgi:hypothetical protein